MITPHGHALSKSHCIYLNSKGSGNVDDSKEYSGYTSSFQIDNEISKKLLDFINFRDKTIPIEGITSYGSDS